MDQLLEQFPLHSIDGIFFTKSSPPCIASKAVNTRSTPLSRVIMNRVIRSSVIGNGPLIPSSKGMREPLEPMTFPYRTTEKRVPPSPEYELLLMNNLSEVSFVAP